jgi:hypothetical protein
MQTRTIPVRPSILHLCSIRVLSLLFLIWYIISHRRDSGSHLGRTDTHHVFLSLIPMLLTYMSQKEYEGLTAGV